MYVRPHCGGASASERAGLTLITIVFLGFVVILLSVLLAVAGLILVQRLVPLELRESHTTAISIIYAALYVMFGVMVGFSAYLVLNKYDTSQKTAESEAGDVEEIYWLAEQFPEPER